MYGGNLRRRIWVVSERMHVWDANGNGQLDFDCADINQSTLGYIVPQNVLAKALETVREELAAITVCPGVRCSQSQPRQEIDQGGVERWPGSVGKTAHRR